METNCISFFKFQTLKSFFRFESSKKLRNRIPPFKLCEYEEYKNILDSPEVTEGKIVMNDSPVHAVMVTGKILKKAGENGEDVNMFCGEFSLFREGMKRRVEKTKEWLKKNDQEVIKNPSRLDSFHPYDDLMNELKEFFQLGRTLNVIVENGISGIERESNWSFLREYVKKDQLKFSRLRTKFVPNHFIVSGNTYRQEDSDKYKTAFVSFNNSEYSKTLQEVYSDLMKSSEKINFEL